MVVRLTDEEIAQLIQERKPLPTDFQSKFQIRRKRGHFERELDLRTPNGSDFQVILRQSLFNHLDFSVILAFRPQNSNYLFRLRRYNGKSHEHSNTIEGQTFYDFHIHHATERYQEIGAREDAFAEPTDRYADFQYAIRCMIRDCGFELPDEPQMPLFGELEP